MLVDSNILIFALNDDSPKQQRAQQFLRSLGAQFFVAHQNVLEAVRVLTYTKFANPMTSREAQAAINSIVKEATIISPDATAYEVWRSLIRTYDIKGDVIFDAYLAATALAAGIDTIATDNAQDFKRFQELKIINPFAAK